MILKLEFDSVTLLLKESLMASQPKWVNCSQGLALPAVLSASYLIPYPCPLSQCTLDSQFLKCTGAHVHPALSARKALLDFSNLTPPLQPSDLRASISSSVEDSPSLPLTMLTAPRLFPLEHRTELGGSLISVWSLFLDQRIQDQGRVWWCSLCYGSQQKPAQSQSSETFEIDKWIIQQFIVLSKLFYLLWPKPNSSWTISVNYL